jgi:hypothetical protein
MEQFKNVRVSLVSSREIFASDLDLLMIIRNHWSSLKIIPPRSSLTVVRVVGMPYALAVLARAVTLLITIVGS